MTSGSVKHLAGHLSENEEGRRMNEEIGDASKPFCIRQMF
jgi:hypothetical protein